MQDINVSSIISFISLLETAIRVIDTKLSRHIILFDNYHVNNSKNSFVFVLVFFFLCYAMFLFSSAKIGICRRLRRRVQRRVILQILYYICNTRTHTRCMLTCT